MEESIKDPEYPDIADRDVFTFDELKEFLNKDKDIIKSYLHSMEGSGSKHNFSISSDKLCLMVPAENIREYYKATREELIKISTFILKSHQDLIVESVNIPVNEESPGMTCLMEVKFKRNK